MNPSAGYLDIQINGYAGVDFNADQLGTDDMARACQRLRNDGVDGILATVITADIESICRRLQNICRARREDPLVAELIWGIHIEGPFLNEQPGYIGAHPPEAARPANIDSMRRLLDAAEGLTRIVTLAPERDQDNRVTRMLADLGICVSAGHCNPSLDELRSGIDAGLSMITHLGNGCPLTMHRHNNIIQRVLSLADQLWIAFIVDGVHVPYFALNNYLTAIGTDRVVVVTDAIEAAGCGPGKYKIGGRSVIVDEQLATWAEDKSFLVGSATTMPAMVENLRRELHLSDGQIDKLTKQNPRAAIGMTTGVEAAN